MWTTWFCHPAMRSPDQSCDRLDRIFAPPSSDRTLHYWQATATQALAPYPIGSKRCLLAPGRECELWTQTSLPTSHPVTPWQVRLRRSPFSPRCPLNQRNRVNRWQRLGGLRFVHHPLRCSDDRLVNDGPWLTSNGCACSTHRPCGDLF